MDILHSNWLIQMLRKSARTPEARMLALFDVLDDWSNAPGLSVKADQIKPHTDGNALKTYLAMEAEKAGAALPDMLSNQLYFMALSAMQEKVVNQNESSMLHAKNAADALIKAQTKKDFHIARSSAYAIAASFIGALFIGSAIFFTYQYNQPSKTQLAANNTTTLQPTFSPQYASPASTAILVAEIEQMRQGNCRLLEAIQLPDQYKSIYFQNIVLGQISTDPTEQRIVRELLSKIRCNYTPMLMKKST